ncbi:BA14K family protein [Nitratireductor sp. GCM10026969]|uniref:BA14K family protein n=1 Tax=Nitratireductor sp. GCM10026969 TaxID=3252645 RepID=UPI003610E0EA
MRQTTSKSLCAAIAMTFALGTATPTVAAPIFVPKAPEASSEVTKVQDRRPRWRRDNRREHRRDLFERRRDGVYWRGHRGFRERRPGYRQRGDWWFPPAAFALGAIIGGAMQQPQYRGLSEAHVRWCYDRYRSYRASDNTFQPYNGPRRPCNSPYS